MFIRGIKYSKRIWRICIKVAFFACGGNDLCNISSPFIKDGDGQLCSYFGDFNLVAIVHGAAPFKCELGNSQFNGRMPRHQICGVES